MRKRTWMRLSDARWLWHKNRMRMRWETRVFHVIIYGRGARPFQPFASAKTLFER